MKLYYAKGACSLSPHIVLRELGMTFDLERVDLSTKKTESGKDFKTIGKGYVPVLELDGGGFLTEGPAIVQYLADQKPDSGLAPKWGTMERYRLIEWLNFISTEIHKGFSPLFNKVNDEADAAARKKLETRIAWVDGQLKGKAYVMGDKFTVADAYLFTVLNWSIPLKMDLSRWPNVVEYRSRIAARPHVQEAMEAEGLLKKAAA